MNGTRLNGTTPKAPVWGAFTPIHIGGMSEPEPVVPAEVPAAAAPTVDVVALAQADAIRTRAAAEAEAIRIRAAEEAEKQRISNARSAMRLERETAEHHTKLADLTKRREQADREAEAARRAEAETAGAVKADETKRAKSATSWRRWALGFAIACALVALPVQMSAFYNRHALWLLAAPVFLEGLAWVVLKGAAAAVDDHRPYWHYRLIAWAGAFVAATINFSHGISHFDLATALGTAFASIAGPGVWDLHEHGRIRLRDGKPTRAQRRRQRTEAKHLAAQKAAGEKRAEAERKANAAAERAVVDKLAAERAAGYATEWAHAELLAAALGEITVTEEVWARAWYDLHGTDPGDTVDTIRTRRTAERRVEMARGETPANTPSKVTNAQRAIQVKAPRTRSSYRPTPPRRTKGDTAPFHPVAKALAADAKRQSNAAREDA